MLYFGLIKVKDDNVTIIEVDTNEKYLNNIKETEAIQYIKSLGGTEQIYDKIPDKIPDNLNNTHCLVKSNELISNRLTVYLIKNKVTVEKGWLFNTMKDNIVSTPIIYYDVIMINKININNDDKIYGKYIYDVNDFRKRKIITQRDGDSLLNISLV